MGLNSFPAKFELDSCTVPAFKTWLLLLFFLKKKSRMQFIQRPEIWATTYVVLPRSAKCSATRVYRCCGQKNYSFRERETDTFVQKPVSIGLNGSEEMGRELLLSRLRINDWLVPLISFAVAILPDHHSTCRALQFKQLQCCTLRSVSM